jgi:tellurite resistance protein TerA
MTEIKLSPSQNSIADANLDRARFSGHGTSKGSAGYIDPDDMLEEWEHLASRGDMIAVSPPPLGFPDFTISAAWDNRHVPDKSFFGKLFKKTHTANVDLDLGCLYELHDGHVGALQAFGNLHGSLEHPPYIKLSEDERTGNRSGDDEMITASGINWKYIKRVLIYTYIYSGADDFFDVKPQIQIRIPNQNPMIVTLGAKHLDCDICAIASLENVRNGIKLTNHTEYFHGHAEMDRAFGFGIEWADGQKDGAPPPHKSRG